MMTFGFMDRVNLGKLGTCFFSSAEAGLCRGTNNPTSSRDFLGIFDEDKEWPPTPNAEPSQNILFIA